YYALHRPLCQITDSTSRGSGDCSNSRHGGRITARRSRQVGFVPRGDIFSVSYSDVLRLGRVTFHELLALRGEMSFQFCDGHVGLPATYRDKFYLEQLCARALILVIVQPFNPWPSGRNRITAIPQGSRLWRSSGPAGPSIRTSMKHGLVGLVLIRKVDGLVLARREIDVAQHLAAARALALDMDHKGGALALLAQNSAQAEHRVDVAQRDLHA